MTSFQRIVRDVANLLAILLVAGIFISTASLLFLITGGFSLKDHIVEQQQNVDFSQSYSSVEEIEIDIASASLNVVVGSELKVETNDNSISVKQKKNKLKVEENAEILSFFDDTVITLYLPADVYYKEFEIETGSGAVSIESLNCQKLGIDLGAGKTSINNLNVTDKAEIDAGTGKIQIDNCKINNLDFDLGVGKGTLNGTLTGKNRIDVGVGDFVFTSQAPMSAYTIDASTGLGEFTVGSETITDDRTFGSGETSLRVSGGVGNVKIEFAQ